MQGSISHSDKQQEQKALIEPTITRLITDLKAAAPTSKNYQLANYADKFERWFKDPNISVEQFVKEVFSNKNWLDSLYNSKKYEVPQAIAILEQRGYYAPDDWRMNNLNNCPATARKLERSHYWNSLMAGFLDGGIDLSKIKDMQGETLLHSLCKSETFDFNLALKMVQAGFDPTIPNTRGETALDLLQRNNVYFVVLKSSGVGKPEQVIEQNITTLANTFKLNSAIKLSAPFFRQTQAEDGKLQESQCEYGAD